VRKLKPLLVVLGGIREVPIGEAKREERRYGSSRSHHASGHETIETRVRGRTIRMHPEQWKAAHRFVKNSNRMLQKLTYSTTLGRITLVSRKPQILQFREAALLESAEHNTLHKHWHVVVELTPQELGKDACNQLLTIYGGELPDLFFL
jgi:hypothetical protein